MSYLQNCDHYAILAEYLFVQAKGPEWRAGIGVKEKFLHPVMLDIGVENV